MAGGKHVGQGSVRPRLLPRRPGLFVNRTGPLSQMRGWAQDAIRGHGASLIAVTGQEGMGKTSLSVMVGHLLAEHFPDGQLYYDLNGSDPDAKITADRVARHFLSQLGFKRDVPDGAEDCLSKLRSVLAGRRVIMMLDDVATVEQVRPLLFESPHALVMVTSRNPLAYLRLDGFRPPLELDRFSAGDAAELISAIAGRDVVEGSAAARLCDLCEGCRWRSEFSLSNWLDQEMWTWTHSYPTVS